MSTLKGQFIADSYQGLLHTSNSSLSSSSFSQVYDGLGSPAPLRMSSTTVELAGIRYPSSPGIIGQSLTVKGPDEIGYGDIFPINSVYFTATDMNPASFLGGVWQRIAQGRFIASVGTGNDGTYTRTISAGNSGGKYQHILDETEMPSHSHLPSGNPDFPFYVTWNAEGVISRQEAGKDKNPSFSFPNTRPLAQEMGSSGEDQPHENTPPAFGLFVWQRVA